MLARADFLSLNFVKKEDYTEMCIRDRPVIYFVKRNAHEEMRSIFESVSAKFIKVGEYNLSLIHI